MKFLFWLRQRFVRETHGCVYALNNNNVFFFGGFAIRAKKYSHELTKVINAKYEEHRRKNM